MDAETLEMIKTLIDNSVTIAIKEERFRIARILLEAEARYSGYEQPSFDFEKSMRDIAYDIDPDLAP